jgi:tetratricopeptide (TPR) repeat protein
MKNSQSTTGLLAHAFSTFQKGDLDKAQATCQQILLKEPESIDVNHLLGVIYLQKQMFAKALPFFDLVISKDRLQIKVWSNRSLVLAGLRRFQEALVSVDKAIELDPLFAEAFYNKANILLKQDRLKDALPCLDRFIAINPKSHFVFFLKGNTLRQLDLFEEAIDCYRMSIELEPNFVEALLNLGLSLSDTGNFEDSIIYFDRVLSINPNFHECHINKGATLERMGKFEQALECFHDSLKINPASKDSLLNCGITLEKLGRLEEAINFYDQLIALDDKNQSAHFNRGYVLEKLQKLDDAIKSYDKAIELEPNKVDAYWNRSLVYLCKGDYERGWVEYENRLKLKMAENHYWTSQLKQYGWNGEPFIIKDKTLLVRSEQGLGDTIQFCRYVKSLSEMGANVVFQVQKPLIGLLKDLDGISQIIHEEDPVPEFDYICNLMSLPLLFKTQMDTIPSNIPYIKADPERVKFWDKKLGKKIQKRVGLVWSGGFRPDRPDLWLLNKRRNITLAQLLNLKTEGVEFHSLQKGELPEAELVVLYLQNWDGPDIINHADLLTDFTETAALLENLDLLISVDTSTAHLAGALGKPVWLMNRFDTCWRWFLDRSDSPWYPTFRIFRQKSYDDWSSVVEEIKEALIQFSKE